MGLSSGSGKALRIDGSTVYNALKAAAFENLDLSAKVGARSALCYFKVKNNTGNNQQIIFRKDGDADNFDGYSANSGITIPNGQCAYVTGLTANTGVIEWFSTPASGTVTLTLEAFIV